MTKQVYQVLTGEIFEVHAENADEALAKFFVSQGYADSDEYPQTGFDFTNLEEDVEYLETDTRVVE